MSLKGDTVKMVKEVEYFMTESLSLGIYNSCKNVYSPSLNNYAFSVLCGTWGVGLCNPTRLFDYLGDVYNNPYVPFNVRNEMLNKSSHLMTNFNFYYFRLSTILTPIPRVWSHTTLPPPSATCLQM
jgi:hypothetical protein